MAFKISTIKTDELQKLIKQQSSTFLILPLNYVSDEEPVFAESSRNFLNYSLKEKIAIEMITINSGSPKYLLTEDISWVGPTIFISSSLISQNPDAISVALNLLSNYIYDFFRSSKQDVRCNFELIIEKSEHESIKLKYDGAKLSPEDILAIIQEIKK